MASKTILLLLGLTIIAVAYGAYIEQEEEDTGISLADLEEYFNEMQMEKRGGKKIGRKLFYSTFFDPFSSISIATSWSLCLYMAFVTLCLSLHWSFATQHTLAFKTRCLCVF